MSSANYGGSQPETSANVKTFVTGSFPDTWKYTTINGVKYLTMASSTNSLYLHNDLTVEGDIKVLGDLTVDGTIYTPSDENLKHDIKRVSSRIVNSIMELTPISFAFNSDATDATHYGFIAQQVDNILPNLVKTVDGISGTHKSVNYIELIPLLLAKIQDLQKQINGLKNTC
jgi:hypothetical protein